MKLRSIAQIIEENKTINLCRHDDIQGWNSDHKIFDDLISETKPINIVELGSWKGRSAMHMAKASERFNSNIYCLDTWLGGIDHMLSDKPIDDRKVDGLGQPTLYHQFITNFDRKECTSRIFPVQNTTSIGLKFLWKLQIKAQLIYVDASHEYEDVYSDINLALNILDQTGIMFGDDFRASDQVFHAVLRATFENRLNLQEVDGNFWILRRNK